jgi:hypothetical protein
LELDHSAEVPSERDIEAGDELYVLFEQVAYNPSVVGDCDGSGTDISGERSVT